LYRIYVSIADILLATYQAENVFFVNLFPFQDAFSMCKVLAQKELFLHVFFTSVWTSVAKPEPHHFGGAHEKMCSLSTFFLSKCF
jgi:hypothetical protein